MQNVARPASIIHSFSSAPFLPKKTRPKAQNSTPQRYPKTRFSFIKPILFMPILLKAYVTWTSQPSSSSGFSIISLYFSVLVLRCSTHSLRMGFSSSLRGDWSSEWTFFRIRKDSSFRKSDLMETCTGKLSHWTTSRNWIMKR